MIKLYLWGMSPKSYVLARTWEFYNYSVKKPSPVSNRFAELEGEIDETECKNFEIELQELFDYLTMYSQTMPEQRIYLEVRYPDNMDKDADAIAFYRGTQTNIKYETIKQQLIPFPWEEQE